MGTPLAGLRVLEIGQWIAGPYCAAILGDLGADVIKVERPLRGDDQRHSPPFVRGMSALFSQINRSKRSVILDLGSPDGIADCINLAEVADIVIDNYRVGALSRSGIRYSDLAATNPKLIYCAISGFGQSGVLSGRPGMDLIAQSISGLADLNAEENGHPKKLPMAICDISTALYATIGILAALASRERSGHGQFIDVSLLESTLAMMPIETSICTSAGANPRRYRERGFGNAAPYQIFKVSDGFIALAAASQPLWESLCDVVGRSQFKADPRFVTSADRIQNALALEIELSEVLKTASAEQWLARFDEARIPAGPVMTTFDILNHPHIEKRGLLVDTPSSGEGLKRVVATPIKFSNTPINVRSAAPTLGEHSKEILRALAATGGWPASDCV